MSDYVRNHMFFALSTIVMLTFGAYASLRLVYGLEAACWVKIVLTCSIFLSSQSISFMRILVTKAQGMPLIPMRIGGYVSALFMTLVSVTLVRDLGLAGIWAVGLFTDAAWPGALLGHIGAPGVDAFILVACAVFAAFGMWSALRVPAIKEVDVNLPELPSELDGLRIAHLSDLHIGSTFDARWLRDVVHTTNAMDPDLTLITGDLVDGEPHMLADDMMPLTELRAKLGVALSVGNHEYYSGVMPWVRTWRSMGLTVLLNEHLVVEINGKPLVIVGIADPSAAKFPGLVLPDPEGALEGAPDGFKILMAHQPKEAREYAALGYDVQLSGHTHGGQYFFLFPLVYFMNRGYRSGLYDVNGMKLYVSPGTGLWGYVPMRLGCPSEITILTLRAGYRPE